MTKRDLVMFLERARLNREYAARKAYSKKNEEIRDTALEKYGFAQVAADMEANLNKALESYKKWVDENDGKNGICVKPIDYNHIPASLFPYTKWK